MYICTLHTYLPTYLPTYVRTSVACAQVTEVCRRGRRPKTTTVLPNLPTATVLVN